MSTRFAVLCFVMISATAAAQTGALQVACGDCNAFQGIEVELDGASMNTGNIQASVKVENISPGEHQVKVYKWNSPFSREELSSQVMKFTNGIEIRAKTSNGKLVVYGKGPVVVVAVAAAATGPSRESMDGVRELLGEARDYAKDAADANEDADSSCTRKVGTKLEVIIENLKDLRAEFDPSLLKRTINKAEDTRNFVSRECPKSVARTLDRKLEKVVGKLQKADALSR